METIRIGDIVVKQIIEDARAPFVPSEFLPDSVPEAIAAERDWMEPRFYDAELECFILSVHSYLFETDGRTVLIDTCVGNGKEGRNRPSWNHGNWPYLENLAAAGYRPEDIDVILCTHLHVDHVGWNTRLEDGNWVPTFPNAQHLVAQAEMESLEYKRKHGPPQNRHVYEDSVLPIIESGQAVLVDSDHRVADGVRLEPSPGHTPGHVSVRIASNGDEAVAIGDMIHHPIQALYPDWNSRVCEDAAQARATRRAFLESLCGTRAQALPGHFGPCRVERAGAAYRFVFD